jgi:hypothetical protein
MKWHHNPEDSHLNQRQTTLLVPLFYIIFFSMSTIYPKPYLVMEHPIDCFIALNVCSLVHLDASVTS